MSERHGWRRVFRQAAWEGETMLDRFVAYNARMTGDEVAFGSLSRKRSYALLEATVSRLAHALEGLRSLNLCRVAVQCPDTWRHWALTLALGRLGLVSASLSNGDVSEEELATLRPDLIILHGPGGLLPGEGRLALGEDWFSRALANVEDDDASCYYPPVPVERSAPCRAALASGTGREPHLLELSFGEVEEQLHRIIYHDMVEYFTRMGRGQSRMVGKPQLLCTVGPQSLSGFLMMGAALAGGTTLRSSDAQNIGTEVMQAPALMIVMTPVHLRHLLRALPPQGRPMSHIYLSIVGGRLSDSLLKETTERFTPHVQVVYGTDESGLVAAMPADQRRSEDDVGAPLPWVDVEIVDAGGNRVPAGEVGEIRIRGGGVVRGYVDDNPAAEQRFRDGWFYPGDRGFMSARGGLHLRGRMDALVNAGGAKFDLEVVEDILRSETRIRDVGVFMMTDGQGQERFYAAIVSHESFDEQALSARLRKRYPALPPVVMIWVPEIPRTQEGHVDRRRLEATLKDYIQRGLHRGQA
ncbi:AMP-binding protein [Bombella sp. ESL0368]|uniref:class I adenylate-forming enzyme family protein n=1 Tax=Parasaccharibacter sp. TMW 2.1884 TaxID=2267834 RepID=UPI001319AD5F|nr:class I adenylate-forming enzyme family protein [Parasaccharibacter sp. TMW 2.1884]QGT75716.1 AMP-binding protein [Bombella sp. ESL0368]